MNSSNKSRLTVVLLLLCAATVLLVAVLPYAGGYSLRKALVGLLMDRWFASESTTWQYGALVPFAVAWLVWLRRSILVRTPVSGSFLGLGVLLFSLFCYFVGNKANNYYYGYLAMQLFVGASVMWTFGWRWFRALLFPWLVLGTAWPLYFLEDRIGFPLRLLSTEGVMCIVRWLHLPVIAEGTLLFSASTGAETGSWMTLKIDGPCSGMNTLFALMFVALLFSHFQQPTLLRRAGLFLLSIPLAILGNMVRIGVLIAGCAAFGQNFAVGSDQNEMSSFHLFAGLLVFVIAFSGLQAASRQFNRWFGRPKPDSQTSPGAPSIDNAIYGKSMALRGLATLLLAAGTTMFCYLSPAPRGGQESGVVMQLPQRVGPLVGISQKPDKVEQEKLPTDTEFAKMTYTTATSDASERDIARVSIVLAGAESRSIHRPEVCLSGQGWTITNSRVMPVEIAPGRTLMVKDLTMNGTFATGAGKSKLLRAHYVYWFAGNGLTTPAHFDRLWRSTWDAVLHNVNHRWAYASIMSLVTENLDPEESGERRRTDQETERLISFLIQNLVPQFQKDFFPKS